MTRIEWGKRSLLTKKFIGTLVAVLALVVQPLAVFPAPAAAMGAGAVTAYNTFPATMPGSFPSLGYEATQTSEFGDYIQLGGGGTRVADSVDVSLTSWACENDTTRLSTEACVTAPGATYSHAVTLNIYTIDNSGPTPQVGSLVKTVTQNVAVPYRPSYDAAHCAASDPVANAPFGGKWYDAATGTCTNGKAFTVSFDLGATELPNNLIAAVAFSTAGSGPFDSLNLSLATTPPSTGVNADPDAIFWNTAYAPNYTDGGVSGVSILRQDTGWAPYTPVMRVNVLPVPSTVYVDDDYTAMADGGHIFGYDAFNTIQAAIEAVTSTGTVNVAAGEYREDVNVNKEVSILGAGAGTTSIVGTTGNTTPVFFGSNNAEVDGFTITHHYTSGELATWNFNNNGVTFGQLTTGNTLSNSVVTLNRNGVYLNNSQGNTIIGNTIANNRTGINMTNTLNNTQIIGNTISENWTVGMVMYNSGLPTDLSTVVVKDNIFNQNWYSEVLIKDGASLLTSVLDVTDNTFNDTPVTFSISASSTLNEPGFTSQKPAVLVPGGAVKPTQEYPTLRIYNSPSATLGYVSNTLDSNNSTITLNDDKSTVTMPKDTVITPSNPSAWNGIVEAPAVVNTAITPTGMAQGVAIQVGSSNTSLSFDKAARLEIEGEAGKRVGFQVPGGVFTEITTICGADDQAAVDLQLNTLGVNECKMNVGNNLVVWTKHFTLFATFSAPVQVSVVPLVQTPSSRTATSFASVFDTASTTSTANKAGDVLGTQTTKKKTAKTPVVEAAESGWKIFGLAWYWWVVVVAALAAVVWYLALRRRNAEN